MPAAPHRHPGGALPNVAASDTARAMAQDWQIPSAWQAIDFISDLHLCEALPRTTNAFAQHLLASPADAIVILGDLFELWVGDDMRHRPFEQKMLHAMATAAKSRHLAFMPGNRDFLVGDSWLAEAQAKYLADPTLLLAFGYRVVLTHGDALCLSDTAYQAFRREVRSVRWQAGFLAKPLQERLDIAAQIRKASQGRQRFDTDKDADLDLPQLLLWLQEAQAEFMVNGHTHKPADHALPSNKKRLVLSDWDLDQGHRAEVLRLTATGFQRVAPATL